VQVCRKVLNDSGSIFSLYLQPVSSLFGPSGSPHGAKLGGFRQLCPPDRYAEPQKPQREQNERSGLGDVRPQVLATGGTDAVVGGRKDMGVADIVGKAENVIVEAECDDPGIPRPHLAERKADAVDHARLKGLALTRADVELIVDGICRNDQL
jgi:hypothetical protein